MHLFFLKCHVSLCNGECSSVCLDSNFSGGSTSVLDFSRSPREGQKSFTPFIMPTAIEIVHATCALKGSTCKLRFLRLFKLCTDFTHTDKIVYNILFVICCLWSREIWPWSNVKVTVMLEVRNWKLYLWKVLSSRVEIVFGYYIDANNHKQNNLSRIHTYLQE